ncbi:hypothetical protein Mmc1_2366 [Magnetococcus marinus MC-1]|uniref:Uncharacterized protein n=1 Tax=Magnetococcus marinus (strain ATCC BAA-1437 / JCM 17883 / MC-1) TaxID=156889 RepID=A0LA73_MAGMM|nr:hypothetical protein [Magnetococcus marinus]ABK44866.1 hypothetical protein Mmc1_2366 [Magnetococcus marinus MC-1]
MALATKTTTLALAASLLALAATVTPTKDAQAWFGNGGPWNNFNGPWNSYDAPWNNGWGGGAPWNNGWGGPGYGYAPYGYPGYAYPGYGYAPYPGYGYAPSVPFYPNFGMAAPAQRFSAEDVAMLKGKLGVRPDQEQAWNALVEAAKAVDPKSSIVQDPAVNEAFAGLMQVLDPQQQAMAQNFKNSLLY